MGVYIHGRIRRRRRRKKRIGTVFRRPLRHLSFNEERAPAAGARASSGRLVCVGARGGDEPLSAESSLTVCASASARRCCLPARSAFSALSHSRSRSLSRSLSLALLLRVFRGSISFFSTGSIGLAPEAPPPLPADWPSRVREEEKQGNGL